ncbi:MAG: ribosomal protein S19 family protein [Candidatus Micrarchaeota archaeon]|nr:ribosomal protein S19 family protein [Candidatus Micrarchaeota archaeon]MCX8154668.1 ribosomal protein S19 family protein [Candidatus Micrarchaeota archaeon]
MYNYQPNLRKGYSENQMKDIDLEKFINIVKSRERRAIRRALEGKNQEYRKLILKIRKMKSKNPKKLEAGVRTHCREAVIIPEWLGLKFLVYNGKEWKPVEITVEKLGHRLGEFSFTTKFEKHAGPGIGATRGSKFIAMK